MFHLYVILKREFGFPEHTAPHPVVVNGSSWVMECRYETEKPTAKLHADQLGMAILDVQRQLKKSQTDYALFHVVPCEQ